MVYLHTGLRTRLTPPESGRLRLTRADSDRLGQFQAEKDQLKRFSLPFCVWESDPDRLRPTQADSRRLSLSHLLPPGPTYPVTRHPSPTTSHCRDPPPHTSRSPLPHTHSHPAPHQWCLPTRAPPVVPPEAYDANLWPLLDRCTAISSFRWHFLYRMGGRGTQVELRASSSIMSLPPCPPWALIWTTRSPNLSNGNNPGCLCEDFNILVGFLHIRKYSQLPDGLLPPWGSGSGDQLKYPP